MAGPYSFTPEALRDMQRLNLDVAAMQDMLLRSARITHPKGNRRHKGYLFKVEGMRVFAVDTLADEKPSFREIEMQCRKVGDLVRQVNSEYQVLVSMVTVMHAPRALARGDNVVRIACGICHGSGQINVFDPCERCDGAGCDKCDKGLVSVSRPCPGPSHKRSTIR